MRLSKIYTRTGDKGTTRNAKGEAISKDSTRIHVIGEIDELNSFIGLIIDSTENILSKGFLIEIQHLLFEIGGFLSMENEEYLTITDQDIKNLEHEIDRLNENLEPLQNFILPGGNLTLSYIHVARTVCRRAERVFSTLLDQEKINNLPFQYINRLSDYLFVFGRAYAQTENIQERLWQQRSSKSN